MIYRQYGADNGRLVIYFHGVPGASEEGSIFDAYGKEFGLTLLCFDRFSIAPSINGGVYYQELADEIKKHACGQQVDVIGFSIGAFVALQVCRLIANQIRTLHLISAAAPLEAGDFLDHMAGKQVFSLATKLPALFNLLTYWQSILARFLPRVLFTILFSSATGGDRKLVALPEFQLWITRILQSSFIDHIPGYVRDIKAYIQPWKDSLSDITVNTYVWHGAEDNWSPKAMAQYLRSAIPGCNHMEILDSASHYSCLYEAAPKIFGQLSTAHNKENLG